MQANANLPKREDLQKDLAFAYVHLFRLHMTDVAQVRRELGKLREEMAQLRSQLEALSGQKLSRAEAMTRARIALAAKRVGQSTADWVARCEQHGWDPSRIAPELKSKLRLASPNPHAQSAAREEPKPPKLRPDQPRREANGAGPPRLPAAEARVRKERRRRKAGRPHRRISSPPKEGP